MLNLGIHISASASNRPSVDFEEHLVTFFAFAYIFCICFKAEPTVYHKFNKQDVCYFTFLAYLVYS